MASHLLAFSLPRKGASLRVSVWRKLQRYGSLPLGNSGYLLPNNPGSREKFEWLATTIRGSHGEASVLEVQSIDNYSGSQLAKRFSDARTQDYRALLKNVRNALPKKLPTHKRVAVMGEIVHDADFFDEKFGRRRGFGIDEVMQGWAQQNLSDSELLERGMQLAEGLHRSLGKKE
jgi:hypothetical protein